MCRSYSRGLRQAELAPALAHAVENLHRRLGRRRYGELRHLVLACRVYAHALRGRDEVHFAGASERAREVSPRVDMMRRLRERDDPPPDVVPVPHVAVLVNDDDPAVAQVSVRGIYDLFRLPLSLDLFARITMTPPAPASGK